MELLSAKEIEKFKNFTMLIYGEPGVGKTTMIKSLKGRTLLFSVDGMYHVLSGQDDISIIKMNPKEPRAELEKLYKFILKNTESFDNIVIDNLSTFQKYWLNEMARDTTSGMPELRDYGVVDRVLLDFVSSLKDLNRNIILFAHEKKVDITRDVGGKYTQHQPDVRNLDAIMGIIPIVGRLVNVVDTEKSKSERLVVLKATQSTRAKDQLIGNIETINQMKLIPNLQNNKGDK